jgi:hypothetical protein
MNIFKKTINFLINILFKKEKHEVVQPKTFMESIEFNGFSIKKTNDLKAKTIYINSEKIIKEVIDIEFNEKGGIIIFLENINIKKMSKNKLINFIISNINYFEKYIKKDLKYDEIYGITIGNFVKGAYRSADGNLYDEKSLSIEMIGITSDILNAVAEDLNKEFNQEKVLVKNYDNNKIYMVR